MDIGSTMKKYEERLMKLPNVTGVGIGEKDSKERRVNNKHNEEK